MRRKMVISSLAVYAIILCCFALLVGRTLASTRGSQPSPKDVEKRSTNDIRTDSSGAWRIGKSRYQPSSNETHAYFALYDPALGETKKFEAIPQKQLKHRNFISRDTLKDSEMEIRVHFNGVTAKETMISSGIDEETGKRQGLKLRQLTDGKHFIQLIYNIDDEIQDCEFIQGKDLVDKFLKEFERDMEKAKIAYETEETAMTEEYEDPDEEFFEEDEGTIERYMEDEEDSPYQMRNVTFELVERDEDFPREISSWLNYTALKKSCKKTQKNLKKLVSHSRSGDAKSKHLARAKLERYVLNMRNDYLNKRLPKWLYLCRKKRDLMDVFRMPGTKWCGKGKRAAKYTSLGMFSRTDKCCRIHDTMCPYWIGGFQEKYGLFNWKLNTIMHCRCDKRFRACLKMAKTGAANLVGKLFFNIVQTQCFVLKPEEVCVKTSWWGKCEKKEYRKKAYLRDNVPY